MTRTVDEQVEAAYQRFIVSKCQASFGMHERIFREIARDLLEGKFKEPPLPEIAQFPAYLRYIGALHQTYDELSWYVMADVGELKIRGPNRATKVGAIEAWNAGLRGDKP